LDASSDIIRVIKSRRMRCARHVARMGAMRNAYNNLVGKGERKRSLRRPKRTWENNMRMDLSETVWGRWGLDTSGSI